MAFAHPDQVAFTHPGSTAKGRVPYALSMAVVETMIKAQKGAFTCMIKNQKK